MSNSQQLLQQAAAELLHRREIRRSLTKWCQHSGFEPARHHKLLISELEAIVRGESDRLAIFMPPGSAKSTYASRLFPPWFLAQGHGKAIIAASHTAELAEKWGRSVRNSITEHRATLGYSLMQDNKAAGRWATDNGGEYLAAGVGGAIAGFRADLALIDDPVRSAEDAESLRVRDRAWEWYRSDMYSRLKPGAAIVLVQTRWHEDDLAGRILAEEGEKSEGGQWKVVRLPAIAELLDPIGRSVGEALWPEWEPIEQLERKKAVSGPRVWSALYQQRPSPEEGDYFKRDWFRRYTDAPERMTIYMSGDFAVTEGGGDFTEIGVFGVDTVGDIYVLDWWSGQASSDRWTAELVTMFARWKPVAFVSESGTIRRAMESLIKLTMRESKVYTILEWLSGGDKAANARAIQGMMANGRVFWPKKEWADRVIDQCLHFPTGKHDDAVDALGLFGRHIDKVWAATPAKPEPPSLAHLVNSPMRVSELMQQNTPKGW